MADRPPKPAAPRSSRSEGEAVVAEQLVAVLASKRTFPDGMLTRAQGSFVHDSRRDMNARNISQILIRSISSREISSWVRS